VDLDKRLRERRLGCLQGEVVDQDPALADHWTAYHQRYHQRYQQQQGLNRLDGVESSHDFEQRIRQFLSGLRSLASGTDVVIVSHGEWLRAARNIIEGIPSWQQGAGIQSNADIITLEWQPDGA
jgi:broad specificity phosphatase PhoE